MAAVDSAVNLGVLISGHGSNLQAIIDAIRRRELAAQIKIVISNRADAFGLERARRHGIDSAVIDYRRFPSREAFDRELVDVLKSHEVDLVILAGFMRLLSPVMIQAFPSRIMNIHPALLPAFPGLHVQKAAIDRGARFSGCTVFFVGEGLDDGPIIIQAVVPVLSDDTEQELSERILAQEHRIYPRAIQLYQEGRLDIRDGRVFIKGDDVASGDQVIFNPPLQLPTKDKES